MTPSQAESEAATVLCAKAYGLAAQYASADDLSAACVALLVTALEKAAPELTAERRAGLFLKGEE